MIKKFSVAAAGVAVAAALTACGGGQTADTLTSIPTPIRLASAVDANTEVALHLYQALYGKAPSFTQLNTMKSQIAADGAAAWANSTAASLQSLSNTAFASLVLNNISITLDCVLKAVLVHLR